MKRIKPMGRITAWKLGLAEHGVNEKGWLMEDGSWQPDDSCIECGSRACMCEDIDDGL